MLGAHAREGEEAAGGAAECDRIEQPELAPLPETVDAVRHDTWEAFDLWTGRVNGRVRNKGNSLYIMKTLLSTSLVQCLCELKNLLPVWRSPGDAFFSSLYAKLPMFISLPSWLYELHETHSFQSCLLFISDTIDKMVSPQSNLTRNCRKGGRAAVIPVELVDSPSTVIPIVSRSMTDFSAIL